MHVLIFLINVAATLDKKEYKIYVKKKPKTKQNRTTPKKNNSISYEKNYKHTIYFLAMDE